MQGSPLVSRRLPSLSRGIVISWIAVLFLAAFLPFTPPPHRESACCEPPPPCVAAVLAEFVKMHKTSEEILQGHSKNPACHGGNGVGAILAEVLAGLAHR